MQPVMALSRDEEIDQLEKRIAADLEKLALLKKLRALDTGAEQITHDFFKRSKDVITAICQYLELVDTPKDELEIRQALIMGGYRGYREDPEHAAYSVSKSLLWNVHPPKGATRIKKIGDRYGLISWPDSKWSNSPH
jgi:hypothetical protein